MFKNILCHFSVNFFSLKNVSKNCETCFLGGPYRCSSIDRTNFIWRCVIGFPLKFLKDSPFPPSKDKRWWQIKKSEWQNSQCTIFLAKFFQNFCARCALFFSRKFNFFLLFSFLIIGWGEGGGRPRSFVQWHCKCICVWPGYRNLSARFDEHRRAGPTKYGTNVNVKNQKSKKWKIKENLDL